MARLEHFDREIKLATSSLEPAEINRQLAAFARAELARVISSGEAPASHETYVNGRQGAAEESVEAPGPILYVFSLWQAVVAFALAFLEARSPKRSGRYASSHVVIVNGRVVDPEMEIPASAEVVITNVQPYTRKIEVGAMRMSVPPGIYEDARRAVQRQFGGSGGALSVQVHFLALSSNVHPLVPWILRGSQGRRRDRQAGMPITYPALVMNLRAFGG